MMDSAITDLETLAELCLQSAKTIKGFLATNGSSKLAFDTQALPSFPKGDEMIQRTRNDLRNAAKTLYDLVTGPQECLMESSLTSVSSLNESWEHVGDTSSLLSASIHRFHEIHLPLQGPGLCSGGRSHRLSFVGSTLRSRSKPVEATSPICHEQSSLL